MADEKLELLDTVLNVTRNQLSNSMKLAAELEALKIIERQKNAELQRENIKLSAEVQSSKAVSSQTKDK